MYHKGDHTFRKGSPLFVLLLLIFAGAFIASCAKKQEPMKRPPVPVVVGSTVEMTVPVQLTAIGNVEAISTIQVKSQIGGVLDKVHFREGQDVAKGALLFTIDPRPYEAQVRQSEATLARDIAQREYAAEQAHRYEELVKKGYVSKDQYEQFRTAAATAEATVNADRAVLENAKLQLKYCSIYAPISGRTGSLIVHEGNLVKANADGAMVVINQMRPIYVTFSVPEHRLAEIKKYMALARLRVDAFASKEDRDPERGTLTFVDNTVDPATGTIILKGTFANREKRLWPGQFVNVKLTLTTIPHAVTVPSGAVQTGQQGQYVFVVNGDTADLRPVVAGGDYEGMTVIEKGVSPGEIVVTDGQMLLRPGAKVVVRHPGPPAETGQSATPGRTASSAPGVAQKDRGKP